MKDFKGAYISVESIMRGLNNIIGDEIYILGNGPSLKNCDFNFLKDKTTFALNSSYKKFAELDFYPTYFGCFDPKLIECHYDKFVKLMNDNNKIKNFFFLNENNKGQKQFSSKDENNSRYQKINFLPPQKSYINKSSFNKFYKMHNSGATAALISIILGYKKIILLGCDGNYVEQIPETRLIDASTKTLQILETPKKNPNYWFDNYQEKGEIYSVPDGNSCHMKGWELLYQASSNSCHMKGWELLYQASKIHNVEIINEIPESKIPYFVKKDFNLNSVLVTITNNKYFESCLTLIKSCQKFNYKIIVFYFDLYPELINILKDIDNVNIINFNLDFKDYNFKIEHFKGYFLKTKLLLYCYKNIKKRILYIDSAIYIQKNIDKIFNIISQETFFCVDHSDRKGFLINYNHTHPNFINRYNVSHKILKKQHINSGLFGFDNTIFKNKLDNFMNDLNKMNIYENYIELKFCDPIKLFNDNNDPKYLDLVKISKGQSFSKNFNGDRQDQTILSYLCAKYDIKPKLSKIYKYSIDIGSSKLNMQKKNYTDVDKIVNNLFKKRYVYNDSKSIENEFSKEAYCICHRMNYLNYNNIKLKKKISMIYLTPGKINNKRFIKNIFDIENNNFFDLIVLHHNNMIFNDIKDNIYLKKIKFVKIGYKIVDTIENVLKNIDTEYVNIIFHNDFYISNNFVKMCFEKTVKYPDKPIYCDDFCENTIKEEKYFVEYYKKNNLFNKNEFDILSPNTFFKTLYLRNIKDIKNILTEFLFNKINYHPYNKKINKNKKILIIGNGPSTKQVDFSKLTNIETFMFNSAYRKFEEINYYPTFFSCIDTKLIHKHYDNFISLKDNTNIKKYYFLNNNLLDKKQFTEEDLKDGKIQIVKNKSSVKENNFIFQNSKYDELFELNDTAAYSTFISIMNGYREILLIGCDLNYRQMIDECKIVKTPKNTDMLIIDKTPEKNPNYWFDNYQQKGDIYNFPNPDEHLKGWDKIYEISLYYCIDIINCSDLSKINNFPFHDLKKIYEK
jgi:hypothetical protein